MKIAIFNPYKSQLVAAEGSMDYAYEQIKSVDGMAVEIKAFCNTDEIAKFAPNFIISHYNFTPKFCNIPTYITFNGPTSFKFRGPNDLRYCLAFDGYLTQSKQVAKSLEDLCFGFGKKFHALTNFANSCRKNEFFEVNLTNPKLIYFANNWEVKTGGFDGTKKPRFEELFKYLSTHTNFLELYGDAGGWSWIHNKKMIKGAIPFDDENSLNNVYRGGGVGLALSTHEYQKEGVGNNRIYEIVSSGSICIADDLPFYRETFGDNLFYVTTRDETEMGEQIIKHFEWIKNNPDEAKEKARNAHKIFCEKISMEEMVKNSISFHQEVERKNYLTAGYKADLSRSQKPMVSVVVRSGGRSKEMVARTLDSIAKQTYDNIQVVFILYKDNPELVELAETYKNKFADLIISKSSSPIRSTVMWEGISQTSGEYLAILDDDDIWYANHLSKIMEFFDDNEDAQFVYSGRVYYNENGTFPIKKIFHELGAATSDDLLFDLKYLTSTQNKYCLSGFGKTDYNELLRLNHPIHPCFVVKKSAITKKMLVDPEMHHAEDLYFCAMLYKSGCKFYWMPELTMQMNVHDSNSCTDFESEKLSWSARDRISLRLHHIASWSILSNSKNIASSKDEEFWKRGYVPKLYKIELLIRDSIHRIRNKYIRQKYLKNKAKKFTKKLEVISLNKTLNMILSLINVWLCIFSLAGYSFSFKKYFNQRFGFSLLLTLSGICCLSYLFSITFENIYLPMRFFYFFGLVLFFFFVFFSVIQKWQDHSDTHKILLCETILSPYFLSFFAITNFIYWIYYPSAIFHEFDEFAHWGVTIKEIYVKGRLFRLQDIADNFNSDGGFAYTPMTSISHYFFLKNISPTIFSESIVLFANSLLLTLPIYYCMNFSEKKIGGLKKWLTAFLGSIALVILYTTLIVGRKFTIIYVDSCLGLFFGIVCSHNLLYAKSNKINAVFFNIFLFFSTFFLVLVKDFGLFLAAMTTPLVWINNLGNNKDKCRWMVLRSNVISSVVSIFAILLARLSWQGVVTDKALSYPNLSLQKSVDFFSLTDVQIQIIKNFISNWGHCFTFTEYRVLELFIAICLAAIFIKNLIPKNVRNTILLTLLYVVGSYVMYSLCLLYLYLTRFVEFEALQSASYERYLGTAAYGYLIVLFALISSKIVPAISRDKIKIFTSYILDKKNRSLKVSISLISLTFFLIVIVKIGEEVERGKDAIKREVIKNLELSSANRLQNKAETEMMLPYMKQGVRVMLLYHNLYWPECGIINYELAPYSPVLDNAIFCTFMQDSYNFNTDPEKQKFKITSAKFALYNRIMASMMYFDLMAEIKKYDMVFIPRPDEQLWHDLGYLFVGDYKNSKFFFLNSKGKLEPLPTNSKYN